MFISTLTAKQRAEIEKLTVEQALTRWQTLYAIGRKPRTVHYHAEILRCFRNFWPDLQSIVSEVTDAQCIQFAERIQGYSVSRFNAMLDVGRKIIPEMGCIPRRAQMIIPKVIPTFDELERLLTALDCANTGNAGLVVRFLAFSGLRINEARWLKWSDIREDHIYARGEITKNGKPRCVPFIAGMEGILDRLKRVRAYHARRDGLVLPQANCRKALQFACRLASVPYCTHHTFRHYFATRCIVSGVDIPTVAKWLGHSDNGALLLRVYCHLIDDHSVSMAKRVKVLRANQEQAMLTPTPKAENVISLTSDAFQSNPTPETPIESGDSFNQIAAGGRKTTDAHSSA